MPPHDGAAPGACASLGAGATLGACAARARARLPRFEADLLACRALGVDRAALHAFAERPVGSACSARLDDWVARRDAGEPVAYILGERGFWTFDVEVRPGTLIPRPDTETLVQAALPRIGAADRVLDACTGSGAVALAIAAERPQATVLATDIDPGCIDLCRRNARRLGLAVQAHVADCFTPISEGACAAAADGPFDAIVGNPPYIDAADPHLSQGDLRFEPRRALVGGAGGGLGILARLIREAPGHLRPGGWLCLEHGAEQAAAVRDLFAAAGFADLQCHRDAGGRARASVGRLAGGAR